jgi:hypothetical protein
LIFRGIVSATGKKHYGYKWNDFFHGFRAFRLVDIRERDLPPGRWVQIGPYEMGCHAPCHNHRHIVSASFSLFRFHRQRVFLFLTKPAFRVLALPLASSMPPKKLRQMKGSKENFDFLGSASGTIETTDGTNPASQSCYCGLFCSSRVGSNPN